MLKSSKRSLKVRRKTSKVIGEGGFGCVLKPNITCKLRNGKLVQPSNKYITKLMELDDFKKEYEDIQSIKQKIRSIANYKKYFLIDIHECKPHNTTPAELNIIKRGCSGFKDTKKDDMSTMNTLIMDYWGIRLDMYMSKIKQYASRQRFIHKKMIALVKKGILELNKRDVYHCDIKLQNILYYKHSLKLIDWGFSYKHSLTEKVVSSKFRRYPLHFNMPITVCLFGDSISTDIDLYMQSLNLIDFRELGKYAWNLVLYSRRGHYSLLKTFYEFLKPPDATQSFDEFAISTYADVFQKYTDNETKMFHKYKYFIDIYLPNIDLIGVVSCYISLMKMTNNTSNSMMLYDYFSNYLHKINLDAFMYDMNKMAF